MKINKEEWFTNFFGLATKSSVKFNSKTNIVTIKYKQRRALYHYELDITNDEMIRVASIDPVPGAANNVDDKAVEQGDQVQFRVDLKNAGTDANGNAEPIRGFDVWDVLAPGITCAQVSSISAVSATTGAPIGECTNPGDSNHPTFSDNATLSAIRWTARSGSQDQILPGASRTMTYEVAIPTPSRAGADLVDTAHVRSYDVFNEQSDTSTTYYPLSNVDTTVAVQDQLIPAIFDPSNVFLVDVFLKKAVIATGITDTNNSALTEAVNGETVTVFCLPGSTNTKARNPYFASSVVFWPVVSSR